ncbi:MAG: hypothetical protein LUE64_06195 [Candidatus Gastranaerophilales bacterium]|nr:hypothetical protein [Candidatus Gastranaerophilales bacterium]
MQNIEQIQVIDLSKGTNSQEIIDNAVLILDSLKEKNAAIKLHLGAVQINQSQMVFIKSLIESYGHKLAFVETTLEAVRDISLELGINTTNGNFLETNENTSELQNSTLDDLREEFRLGFENRDDFSFENEENTENSPEKEPLQEENAPKSEDSALQSDEIETNALQAQEEINLQKQTISIYRKADEKENEREFQDKETDFYATPTDEPVVVDTKNTIYVNQTLRSGQVLDYDGNVVIIGDCHPGSEIKATGDITVWGVLGSVAHAGIKGNCEAKIRALKMNAVQLRIANCYSRRPDGSNIPYIVKSSVFVPEEARIVDDNIVLFKLAQD